jgi:hypothetical protein
MPVVIREIVTEVALSPVAQDAAGGTSATTSPALPEEELDRVVRRCTERVLETLRREWGQ